MVSDVLDTIFGTIKSLGVGATLYNRSGSNFDLFFYNSGIPYKISRGILFIIKTPMLKFSLASD